jgi:hypothetical protein
MAVSYYSKKMISLDNILSFVEPLFKSCKNGVVYESSYGNNIFRIVKIGSWLTGHCLIGEIYENEIWKEAGRSYALCPGMFGFKLTSDAAYRIVKNICEYMEGRN